MSVSKRVVDGSKSGEIALESGMLKSQVDMMSDMLAREALEVSVGRADARRKMEKRRSKWVTRFMMREC